jgi:ribonuclease R
VAQFGVFVQYPKYLIDGLIHMDDLGDDWWEVDVRTGRVHGKRTRRTFALGQVVTAVIDSIDLPSRQLNFALAGAQRASPRGDRGTPGGRDERRTGGKRPRGEFGRDSGRSFGQGRSAGKTGRRGGDKSQHERRKGPPRRGRKGKGGRRR